MTLQWFLFYPTGYTECELEMQPLEQTTERINCFLFLLLVPCSALSQCEISGVIEGQSYLSRALEGVKKQWLRRKPEKNQVFFFILIWDVNSSGMVICVEAGLLWAASKESVSKFDQLR
jgi:hypothetical protein